MYYKYAQKKGWKLKMGSWDETCSLSNLPICEGDRIVCIPLTPTAYSSNEEIYPDGRFQPFGFPVRGVYEDYGIIGEIEYPKIYLEFLKDKTFYVKTDNGYSEVSIDSAESFIERMCDGDLYVEKNLFHSINRIVEKRNEKVLIRKMFIHESLYDILCCEMKNRIPYKCSESMEILNKENIRKQLMKYAASDNHMSFEYYIKTSNTVGENMADIAAKYYADKRIDLEEAISAIFNQILFYSVLLYMRKGYLSQSGKGSQSREYYLHKLLADWINEKCKKEEQEFSYEDFPDSNPLKETMFFYFDD